MSRHLWWQAFQISAALAVPLAASAAQDRAGRVEGTVYDNVAQAPLVQATVLLVRADDPARSRSVRTDARGHFRFDDVAGAGYLLSATHPRLDTLAIDALQRAMTVSDGRTAKVRLETSTAEALRARVCGAPAKQDVLSGFVHGQLRDAGTARSFGSGTVRVAWNDVAVTADGVQQTTQHVDVTTSPTGAFILCGVPVGGIIRLSAARGADSTGVVEIEIPANGIARRDLSIGSSVNAVGQVAVTVRGLNGTRVPNARVSVWGTHIEATTDTAGRVVLSKLPSGTHTLSALAIGYEPTRMPIDIEAEGTTAVAVSMPSLQYLSAMDIRTWQKRGYAESMSGKSFGAIDARFGTSGVFTRIVPMQSVDPWQTPAPSLSASSCEAGGVFSTGASIARLSVGGGRGFWSMVGGLRSTSDQMQDAWVIGPLNYEPMSYCPMQAFQSELDPRSR